MLIPIFTVYARQLDGATPTLTGMALGAYGLSQGLLQIPFGLLSDRYGRKTMITIGLLLFAVGSLYGALTHSMYGMIVARILQGTGAIGSVLIALLADLTPESQRTKAMAVIGVTIGLSFSLAMVLSPVISHRVGLAGIFFFTNALALAGLLMLHLVIPTPKAQGDHLGSETKLSLLTTVLGNPHLLRLNAGIFLQHAILTATFFAVPLLLLQQQEQGHLTQAWHFYLPLMVVAFLLMVPCIILAERRHLVKPVFLASVLGTAVTQALLAFFYPGWMALCLLMLLYFVAFNILEANLPSLISKQASPHNKGTAMGVYSSCQFLGIFVGGLLAGVLFQYTEIRGLFLVNAALGTLWFLLARGMNVPANRTKIA